MATLNLLGFAAALRVAVSAQRGAERHGLEAAAKLIEAEAKAELGSYQPAAGPFGAWPQLADRTQVERAARGFSANDPGKRTGEMQASISHTVDGHKAVVGSHDQNLVYFELGTSKQPPRSVLGAAAFKKGAAGAKLIGKAVQHAIAGRQP